jgi:ribosomal protein S3
MTKYGIIGIKVWIAKSELFAKAKQPTKKDIVL